MRRGTVFMGRPMGGANRRGKAAVTKSSSAGLRSLEIYFCVLALAMMFLMAASSAEAVTKAKRHTTAARPPAPGATATCRGGNLFPCGPIYSGNDYLGTDPDPFIRLMIQRDLGVHYGGAP
jgi:hypothetical protein